MTAATTPSRVERFRFAQLTKESKAKDVTAPRPVEPVREQVKRGTQALMSKPEPAAQAPATPAAPAITALDLETAKKEAQDKGYREGVAATEEKFKKEAGEREDAIRSLLDVIANRITIAAESHARAIKGQEAALGKLTMMIARKVSGEALKREPYSNVEALLKECVVLITGQPKIIISVAPARVEGLKQRVDTLRPLLPGFEGSMVVEEDSALGEQDCRVNWTGGYGEHNAAKIWSDIESLVTQKNVNS